MISTTQLRTIMRTLTEDRAATWISPINDAQVAFGIDQTKARQAAFLAQVAEESGELRYVREIASGAAYEGRADLGNTQPGDGIKFPGRGLLEVTGRANYQACSLAVYGDLRLLDTPELLEQPWGAAQGGAWFWQTNDLNNLADAGNFERITLKINGSVTAPATHFDRRVAYLKLANQALA